MTRTFREWQRIKRRRRRNRGFREPKDSGFRFKISYILIALLLLIAYSYFSSPMYQYGSRYVYGITPIIYWVVVGLIGLVIYFKVKK